MYHNDYTALEVARYVIRYLKEKGESATGLSIHSILYFIQAEFLARFGYTAFNDPIYAISIGAWIPTITDVYVPSSLPILYWNSEDSSSYIWMTDKEKEILTSTAMSLMEYSSIQLQEIVKSQDPWKTFYEENFRNIISINYLYKYFKRKSGPESFEEEKQFKEKEVSNKKEKIDSCINYKACFIVTFFLLIGSILWQII